jgi:hypothetical protein
MNTDFRALCAELLQLEQEQPAEYTDWKMRYNAAIARARAELAKPEPVAPTDKELYELWNSEGIEADFQDCRRFARAYASRWGTPTAPYLPPEATNA